MNRNTASEECAMIDDPKLDTASAFIRTMQRRFMERVTGMEEREALEHAVAAMEQTEDDLGAFGSEAGAWTEGAAHDIVDEELSYWDA